MTTNDHSGTTVIVTHPPSNSVGTAGFVISLLGFATCGCISPVGLFLSIVGLLQPPRGLALTGVILGSLGSWWLFAGGGALLLGIVGLSQRATEQIEQDSPDVVTPAVPTEEPPATEPIEVEPPPPPEPVTQPPLPSDSPSLNPIEPAPPAPKEPAVEKTTPVEPPPAKEVFREFKSANGKFSVRARFVGIIGTDTVSLRREDTGKILTVPLDQLSPEDQDWIAERSKSSR